MADLLGSLIADWLWWRMRSVTNAEAEFSTSTIASDVQGLTVEKLQEAMRSLPEVPPPPKVDLWPHDLGAGAYEMARGIVDSIPDLRGRRQFFVPRPELLASFHELQRFGCDVRLQPVRRKESDSEDEKHG